jgi:thiol-disulfide isomerase/thioredoxin
MKKIILFVLFAATLLCLPILAQDTANPTNELLTLVAKINTDIQSGKRTEAALSGDLKLIDSLVAEHKDEKTDIMAMALYNKAILYSNIIGDDDKANAVTKQITRDYSGTSIAIEIEAAEAKQAAAEKVRKSLVKGARFPDFDEKDIMGSPLSVANYKGKIVLIDFWATWCVPCRIQLPYVLATYQKYHDKGFEIIGVSLDFAPQVMLEFTKQNNMPWQQYFDGQGWGNKLVQNYAVEQIPTTFLLDRKGRIIATDLRGDDLEKAVGKAVAKK